ncbi:unnamed protein product [Lepeophtheirus salmonis]|uniref:(salmon louse) hypothetical protein n=1 Tax=Lepeophtheirus salmonis TaxID=72036 RepID=A0A7R8D6N5_LEPSM|nr:unnamed protein product [Lepeophtheirus salmonis]CAF3045887.1 unnamed protein product [Lepeophtheirus salmonis]
MMDKEDETKFDDESPIIFSASRRSSKIDNAQDNQLGLRNESAPNFYKLSNDKSMDNRRKITFEGAIDSGDFVTAIGTFLYYDENDNTLNGGMYSSNSEDSIMPASTQYLVRTELNDSEPKVSTPNPSISSTKKKSWYNAFYPNYKSVSEDFKKIFPSIPSDERLIAGYSCAIQKDILVHGRLYFTKKYLCFLRKDFKLGDSVGACMERRCVYFT